MTAATRLIVVGAGPVGAVAAWDAVRHGLHVVLIEQAAAIDPSPRAATFHPSTLEMLDELGIMPEFVNAGLVARFFDFWDRPAAELIARCDHHVLSDDTRFPYVVQTEQHKLVGMLLRRLQAEPTAEVMLGCKLTGLEQDSSSVTAHVVSPEGRRSVRADFIIGADGGRSTVRKSLGIEFEGYTWPERFLVLTTLFDFQRAFDCSYRNYMSDPVEWVNLFKVAGDDGLGRWRAVFATRPDETEDEVLRTEIGQTRLAGLVPDAAAGLVHQNLYKVHQRVARSFTKGRAFLAGDAAHVNNPIGGLGLNCGIHDANALIRALYHAATDGSQAQLRLYETHRRALNIEYVQDQTVANKRRLEETDTSVRQARFDDLAATAADPVRHRQFLLRTSLLESVRKPTKAAGSSD
jgi:3-(3-hydroxy-phenyl)propionate hydroxylase